MATTSKKRKLDEPAPAKYYAVRAGHKPGVYTNWPDCQLTITGFKGASYKSFLTEQDAKDFVAGKAVAGPSASSKPQGDKYYAVAVGLVPGVYREWTEVQEQILGVKGPKYKKFSTKEEAEDFVKTSGKKTTATPAVIKKGIKKEAKYELAESSQPAAKKAKTSTASSSKAKSLKVYTDGSALGNGKAGALAGVGVFFGVGDERNVSEPLEGKVQTNQRAELTAVQRALEIAPRDWNLHIVTDSNYSINCCTVWYKKWLKNEWKSSNGTDVMNRDLIERIRVLIDERDSNGSKTELEWIKGHSNDPSNEAADQLAVAGARMVRY